MPGYIHHIQMCVADLGTLQPTLRKEAKITKPKKTGDVKAAIIIFFLVKRFVILPPTGKNWCKTKNSVDRLWSPGNGIYLMTILVKIDIYGVKNSLIRYLWLLKYNHICIMPFPRFWKKCYFNSFLPTFIHFWSKKVCWHFLKH